MENINIPTIGNDIIEIPENMGCISPDKLEKKVYNNFENNYTTCKYLTGCAIMTSTNDMIHEENPKIVQGKIPEEIHNSYSRDEYIEDDNK